MYEARACMQQPLPGESFAPFWGNTFVSPTSYAPVATWAVDQHTQYPPDRALLAGEATQMENSMLAQPAPMYRRTLLPRTHAPPVAPVPAQGLTPSQRHIRPLVRGRVSPLGPAESVSRVQQRSPGIPGQTLSPSLPLTPPMFASNATSAAALECISVPAVQLDDSPSSSALGVPDPAADEFNSFIRYDQDDMMGMPDTSKSIDGSTLPHVVAAGESDGSASITVTRVNTVEGLRLSLEPVDAPPTADTIIARVTAAPNQTGSSETDEGRHRNHELYSRGPETDGLFHCPYKAKDDCPHKPTKLKCNYDKFIDSHLKPFRCKNDACVKQEFSSTACLLRHEREAHGMHGHGERPHLCVYAGCERGFAGNGFPRRYNLFDHMKRVHDHKEETQSGHGSPDNAGMELPKVVGRKRKAPSSTASEPATQRRKMSPHLSGSFSNPTFPAPSFIQTNSHGPVSNLTFLSRPHTQSPVMYGTPPMGPYTPPIAMSSQPSIPFVHASRQWDVRAQWARQKDLLARQLEHGLPDEAGMERLDRDFREYRRLSDEARHG
ncbi:hypothetical protein LTR95_005019 [Oleoguttula sp. CCFEE 5521]